MNRRLAVLAAALVVGLSVAGSAAADYWGQSDFNVTWPSSGHSIAYRMTVPVSRYGVTVNVDDRWLPRAGIRYGLTCPAFSVRSSMATWYSRYNGDGTATVSVLLTQGSFSWACFTGDWSGSTSDVTIRSWRN